MADHPAERAPRRHGANLNPAMLAVLRDGRRHIARSMATTGALMLCMALLGALLTGCGGGDPEPDEPVMIAPDHASPMIGRKDPEAQPTGGAQ